MKINNQYNKRNLKKISANTDKKLISTICRNAIVFIPYDNRNFLTYWVFLKYRAVAAGSQKFVSGNFETSGSEWLDHRVNNNWVEEVLELSDGLKTIRNVTYSKFLYSLMTDSTSRSLLHEWLVTTGQRFYVQCIVGSVVYACSLINQVSSWNLPKNVSPCSVTKL